MILEVKDLKVYYGKVCAVKGISLSVAEGEFVTIIGANGAGKSSALNAISGLTSRQGEIWFRGERIDKLSPPQIASRGIIQIPKGGRSFLFSVLWTTCEWGRISRKTKSNSPRSLSGSTGIFPS